MTDPRTVHSHSPCGQADQQRSTEHDRKAKFLDTLATLIGCRETVGGWLPDGRRPDVLRLDSKRSVLFIGEAKDTESPGFRATQARLQRYLSWLSAHVARVKGMGIFAVCFRRESDSRNWVETVLYLGHEVDLYYTDYGLERFGSGFLIAWFISGTPVIDKWNG